MQSRHNHPNTAQKRWREDVRSLGSIVSGRSPVEIHHCAGVTAKHQKIAIGHYWILPLAKDEHAAIPELGRSRKEWEKEMFNRVLARCESRGLTIPFGPEVYEAIMDYRR